jgi:hypothetical protein
VNVEGVARCKLVRDVHRQMGPDLGELLAKPPTLGDKRPKPRHAWFSRNLYGERNRMVTATSTTDAGHTDEPTTLLKERPAEIEEQAGPSDPRRAKPDGREKRSKRKARAATSKYPNPTPRLSVGRKALKRLSLVAVAYSGVEREFFPTEEAYQAEKEVECRAAEVLQVMESIGVPGRLYSGNERFVTDLLADRPDLVLNLVDTPRGRDALQASIPARWNS